MARAAKTIDLNADLGEGEPHDAALIAIVSSCNIACGGHAGDAVSMRETVRRAQNAGVAIGAHPSYPDREGFGRRSHFIAGEALLDALEEQIAALAEVCRREGATLVHVKPHGALYNDAQRDAALAEAVVSATVAAGLVLVGPPTGALRAAAGAARIEYRREGFVDRAYRRDGTLVPRDEPGALLSEPGLAARQAVSLASDGRVDSNDGPAVELTVDTLCLHGDTPDAIEIATAVSTALREHGIRISSRA